MLLSTNKGTTVYLHMRLLFHSIILETSTAGKVQ